LVTNWEVLLLFCQMLLLELELQCQHGLLRGQRLLLGMQHGAAHDTNRQRRGAAIMYGTQSMRIWGC
jgi:hypothetical protein